MGKGTLVVNFKNYPEILGAASVTLAKAVQRVSEKTGVEAIVAPPTPMLALVVSEVKIPVYSQAVGAERGEKTTGAVLPEAVKAAKASGTILNHSESRRTPGQLRALLPRLSTLSLEVCLCARTAEEAGRLARSESRFIAVEPPELIGTGIAVSKARPELITEAASSVERSGYRGKLLCGAGIATGKDVSRAVELGAEGVMVSSSVVKADSWSQKLEELARPLM